MVWLPFVTAAVLAGLGFLLHGYQRQRQLSGAKLYRQRFMQAVTQLESVTKALNELGELTKVIKDPRALDYYEGTLALTETLLAALRKVEPFGTDPSALNSAFYLIRDLRERVGRVGRAFHELSTGGKLDLADLHGRSFDAQLPRVIGCYFCSRPVIAEKQADVRVRLDGEVRVVTGCKVCSNELSLTRKVKVLHFMLEGQPVHWSKVTDYKPNEDFWGINEPSQSVAKRRLELVPSHTEARQPE